jgi:hypothetical protein
MLPEVSEVGEGSFFGRGDREVRERESPFFNASGWLFIEGDSMFRSSESAWSWTDMTTRTTKWLNERNWRMKKREDTMGFCQSSGNQGVRSGKNNLIDKKEKIGLI